MTPKTVDEMTYYEIFEQIQKLSNHIWTTTTDPRVASCCSEIRVGLNRYFRECVPKRGD